MCMCFHFPVRQTEQVAKKKDYYKENWEPLVDKVRIDAIHDYRKIVLEVGQYKYKVSNTRLNDLTNWFSIERNDANFYEKVDCKE